MVGGGLSAKTRSTKTKKLPTTATFATDVQVMFIILQNSDAYYLLPSDKFKGSSDEHSKYTLALKLFFSLIGTQAKNQALGLAQSRT